MSNDKALAVRQGADLAAADIEERQWRRLMREADVIAKSGLVQRALADNVPATAAVMLACRDLGLPMTVTNIKQFHIIEGSPEPSAQLTLGLAGAAGYETNWGRNDDQVAELSIRVPGRERWQTFAFRIEDAKRAHLLDEWVESWGRSENGKNFKRRYVVTCQAETPCKDARGPVPAWAQKEIDAGNVQHKDNWHNYPADMLRARVAVRAVKAAAPEVRLGLVEMIRVESTPSGGRVVLGPDADDGDITDAVVLDDDDGTEPVAPVAETLAATEEVVDDRPRADQPGATEQPEMVPQKAAKAELVAAAKEAGLSEIEARAAAQGTWQAFRFTGDVERKALDVALADLRAGFPEHTEPDDGTLFDEEAQ